jgi:hypothetical protein
MSVWKEDAYMLEDIEMAQEPNAAPENAGEAFFGAYDEKRGFNLNNLSKLQTNMVRNLRTFCKENAEIAAIKTIDSVWTFSLCMDEGSFGWNVLVEKNGDYLGLLIKAFTRYEA